MGKEKGMARRLRFGQIVKDVGVPVISLLDDTTKKPIGYLSPFRGYKFQVSRTSDGSCDLGSSRVIGLGNCIVTTRCNDGYMFRSNENADGQTMVLLGAMATVAISDFACNRGYIVPNCDPYHDPEFKRFIELCKDYIISNM